MQSNKAISQTWHSMQGSTLQCNVIQCNKVVFNANQHRPGIQCKEVHSATQYYLTTWYPMQDTTYTVTSKPVFQCRTHITTQCTLVLQWEHAISCFDFPRHKFAVSFLFLSRPSLFLQTDLLSLFLWMDPLSLFLWMDPFSSNSQFVPVSLERKSSQLALEVRWLLFCFFLSHLLWLSSSTDRALSFHLSSISYILPATVFSCFGQVYCGSWTGFQFNRLIDMTCPD